jgi:micrococcal nuclease
LRIALLFLAVAAFTGLLGGTAAAATCDDYSNQADAQRAADTRDADGDGLYCETLPCPCSTGSAPPPPPAPPIRPSAEERRERDRAAARARARKRAAARRRRALARERRVRRRYEGRAAQIYEVVDGDTVKVVLIDTDERFTVRLVGIDTPETKHPTRGVECGGPEASDFMESIAFTRPGPGAAPEGELVTVDTDESQDVKDRYGRVLAYLDTHDGLDLGLESIAAGWAEHYVFERAFQRVREYRRAEAGAESAIRGVWGMCGSAAFPS